MSHRTLLIIFCTLLITSLYSQEKFFPNMANSITPSDKNEILLGGTITTTNFGQIVDVALGYSPAKNFGLVFYERGRKGNIAVGGGLGWYKTVTYSDRKLEYRKFDIYTCLSFDKLRHQSYDIKYATYYLQGGITEQYKKWGFNLNSRLNVVDYNTIQIRILDESVAIAREEVEKDPVIFPDLNIKIFYGNEIKGFITLSKPFNKKSILINNKTNFSLGAEINLCYAFNESIKVFKNSND